MLQGDALAVLRLTMICSLAFLMSDYHLMVLWFVLFSAVKSGKHEFYECWKVGFFLSLL